MKKCQIVRRLLVPTDEQTAKAQSPGMCPFHHPAARFEPGFLFDRPGLFPTSANMGGKAEVVKNVAHFLVVVALRQAHSLRFCLCRFGPVYYDPRESRASQFHIMAIGSLNGEANWHPMPFRQQTAFHSPLAPIGGIGTRFFPRPMELWSSPRPYSTSPSQCQRVHQTAQFRLART